MSRFTPVLLAPLFLVQGCDRSPPSTAPPSVDIHAVGWTDLTRDHTTASAYLNRRVRFHLAPGDYDLVGSEIRVFANMRTVPAIIVCRCDSLPSATPKPVALVVVGTVTSITRDGHMRHSAADFWILVEAATVTAR